MKNRYLTTLFFILISFHLIAQEVFYSDKTICTRNATIGVEGTGSNFNWVCGIDDVIIVNPDKQTTDVVNLRTGSNTFQCTYIDGSGIERNRIITISVDPVEAIAPTDKTTCEKSLYLAADNPKRGTGQWRLISGSLTIDAPDNNIIYVDNIAYGKSKVVWTVTDGECFGKDTVVINNVSFPATAGQDKATCNSFVNLQATIPPENASGYWSIIGGKGTIESPSSHQTKISEIGLGTNLYAWTVSNGICTVVDEIAVTYNRVSAVAGSNQTLCKDYTFLAANSTEIMGADAYGIWTTEEGYVAYDNKNLYNTLLTDIAPGSNRLRWTVTANGCSAFDEIVITNNVPSAPNPGDDRAICTDYTFLDGTDPQYGHGTWTSLSDGPVIANPTISNTKVSKLLYGSNVFRWTVKQGDCSAYKDVAITNRAVKASAGTDKTLCENSTSLYASRPSGTIGKWTVVNGQGNFINDTNPLTEVTDLANGNNLLRWTVSSEHCSASDDVVITNNEVSVAEITTTGERVCNPRIQLNALSPMYGSGVWTVIAGSADIAGPSAANTIAVLNQQGINRFKWIVARGECSSTDIIEFENRSVTTNAGLDKVVCGNESMLRAADLNTDATGSWSVIKGYGIISDYDTPTTPVTELAFGENLFVWTIHENQCTAKDTVSITNTYPSQAVTMEDIQICQNHTQLVAETPKYGTGKWTVDVGAGTIDDATNYVTDVTELYQGINRFKWTVAIDDCTTVDVVEVRNNKIETYAGKDKEVCSKETYLSGFLYSTEHAGKWTVVEPPPGSPDFAYVTDITNPTSKVIDLVLGKNTFRWTVEANDCSAYDEVTITNNLIIANAGEDQSYLCDNYTYLGANKPENGFGVWKLTGGQGYIEEPSSHITLIEGLSEGPNTFKWTITSGNCITSDDVVVTNRSVDARMDEDYFICSGAAGQLLASYPGEGTSGSWKILEGSGDIEDLNNYSTNVTNLGKGANVFEWHIQRGNCSDADTMVISNFEFSIDFDNSQIIVCDDNVTLEAIPADDGGTGIWSIDGGQGEILQPNNHITDINGLGVGNNLFRWTVEQNGCSDSETVSVVSEYFKVNAGTNQEVCHNYTNLRASVSQTANSLNAKGIWEGIGYIYSFEYPDGWDNFDVEPEEIPDVFVKNLQKGENKFRWTLSTDNCSFSDEVIVTNNTINYATGEDIYTCFDAVTLDAESPDVNADYYWRAVNEQINITEPNNPKTTVENLPNGTSVLIWHVEENGCLSEESINIYNNKLNVEAGSPKYTEDGTIELTGIPQLFDATSEWKIIDSEYGQVSKINENKAHFSGLDYGRTKIEWIVNKWGCLSRDTVYVTHTFRVHAGQDQLVCNGETNMNAAQSIIAPGKWSIVSGDVIIEDSKSRSTRVIISGNKTAILRWSVEKNGYIASDDVALRNKIQIAGSVPRQVCKSNSFVSAKLPSGTIGYWTVLQGEGIIMEPSLEHSVVGNLSIGENIFRFTVSDGECTNYINQKISYNILEKPGFVTTDTLLCDENTVIEGELIEGASGRWTRLEGAGYLQEQNKAETPVTGVAIGKNVYRWMVTYGDCSAYNDINIYYRPLRLFVDRIVDVDCYGNESGEIGMNATGGYGQKKYSIDNGDNFYDNNGIFTHVPAMNFTGQVVDEAGCMASSMELAVVEPDSLTIKKERIINTSTADAIDGIIELSVSGGTKPYEYYLNETDIFQYPVFTQLSRGIYNIRVVDLNGCKKGVYVNLETGEMVSSLPENMVFNHFKLYPNPAKYSITVEAEFDTPTNYSIDVFDITGRQLANLNTETATNKTINSQFDISMLNPGVYIVRISANKQQINYKLIISR